MSRHVSVPDPARMIRELSDRVAALERKKGPEVPPRTRDTWPVGMWAATSPSTALRTADSSAVVIDLSLDVPRPCGLLASFSCSLRAEAAGSVDIFLTFEEPLVTSGVTWSKVAALDERIPAGFVGGANRVEPGSYDIEVIGSCPPGVETVRVMDMTLIVWAIEPIAEEIGGGL